MESLRERYESQIAGLREELAAKEAELDVRRVCASDLLSF
jgi:hypothetical protein